MAGGQGRRIGAPKALLPYGDSTFLGAVVEHLRFIGFAWLGVVIPIDIESALFRIPHVQRIINPVPEDGQLSSLRLALNRGAQDYPWILTALVDQPAVKSTTYETLVRALEKETEPTHHLWVPTHGGRRGHPVIFGRAMYSDLLAAPLDEGARWAVGRHRHFRCEVEVDDPEVLLDVDTAEDFDRLSRKGLAE